jgi:AmmeMemoRadiSam system protein A
LSERERAQLVKVAKDSVRHGLIRGSPLPVHPAEYPPVLKALRASFVTLELGGRLRGCMGHLEAFAPLVVDVAENAYAAAFRDPRFPAVSTTEVDDLDFHISVLSPAVPLSFTSERDLLAQLRPGIDGLILAEGARRGTFLPSVWDSLPDPAQFLTHLKMKAGLAPNHWSETLKVSRYTTESFGEETA